MTLTKAKQKENNSQDVPWLYVLSVLVASGNFATKQVIAVSAVKEDLGVFLEQWISRNKQSYTGRYSVDFVPFVGDIE
jgi:hypothetical protein